MRVRRYTGPAIETVMERIKVELGPEAVIVSTKMLPGKEYEICAGVDGSDLEDFRGESGGPIIMLSDVVQSTPNLFTGQETIEGIFSSQGLDSNLIEHLTYHIDPQGAEAGISTDKLIGDSIGKILGFESMLPSDKRVIALVGAPGAGKTTTIAKLAARLQAAFGLKIGLIAADSYRVGAGFHLQTYASLMQLPFRLLDPEKPIASELSRAIKAFSKVDLIFVDTPGCGIRESERVRKLTDCLRRFDEIEPLLVLPAPSNDVDLYTAARSFEPTGYRRVILSKIDDSAYIGPAINTIIKMNKSLAFFTTGQRVPEDIEPASARRLGWMLTRTIH